MMTCYGSICAITDLPATSDAADIAALGNLSPYERLEKTVAEHPETVKDFSNLREQYVWFLETTDVSEKELFRHFEDKTFREDAFKRAEIFGSAMYSIVRSVTERNGHLRYLVI